jgi:transcriptional regulator with XRE-family HTH domain
VPDQEPQPPQPHSELASFGEELRREREIRAISLKEIADATKISKRFLEAIEKNDHKTLPAPVFTRGFVREYARYLGLNAEEMVNRYNYAAAGDDRIEQSTHLDRLVAPKVIETPPRQPRGLPSPFARIDRNLYLLILVAVALAGVVWWAIGRKRDARNEEARAIPVPAATLAHKPVHRPKPPEPAPVPTQDETLHLIIDMDANSWIELDADGASVYSDVMRRGEHRTFEAKNEFRFRNIGNAGGPRLTLNGVQIPPVGRDEKVVHNFVLNRKTLTEIPADSDRSQP